MSAVGSIHKLALLGTIDTVPFVNTFWFRQEIVEGGADERATLANDFAGTMITPGTNSWRYTTNQNTRFTAITVQTFVPHQESSFTLSLAGPPQGTLAGTPLPSVVAVALGISTATPGRSGRGRLYPPAPNAADQTQGLWSSGLVGRWTDTMNALFGRYVLVGGVAVSGFTYGVWSRKLGGPPPYPNFIGFSPATGYAVRPEVRALTRRTRPT
jgi:hypothetical protein